MKIDYKWLIRNGACMASRDSFRRIFKTRSVDLVDVLDKAVRLGRHADCLWLTRQVLENYPRMRKYIWIFKYHYTLQIEYHTDAGFWYATIEFSKNNVALGPQDHLAELEENLGLTKKDLQKWWKQLD